MSFTRTAIQILKAWYGSRPEDERFPVDCRLIANEFGVKVQGGDLGGEFEGGLFIDGELRAIISRLFHLGENWAGERQP